MGKTKRKEKSEVEYLRGQIKKLESENRQLRKRVRQLDKRSHLYEDLVDAVAEEIKVNLDKCNKCGEGVLNFVNVGHLKFLVCSACKERTKL